MKYLVTGGAGFIGSHLCERLIHDGHGVVCLDNLSAGRKENIAHLRKRGLHFVQADVTNRTQCTKVFRVFSPFSGIFHHAAVVGVKRTIESPVAVLNDIHGIQNIFELSLQYGKPKIIFASSSEVYGHPVEIPEVESGHVNAKFPYAVTKLIGEKFVESYWKSYELPACALRFFNVYGPKQESSPYGFVVGIFIRQVLSGKAPRVFGDGTQTRDFVYIDDNIEVTIRAMETAETNGEVLNVGTGRPMTILDLAEDIIKLTGNEGVLLPEFVDVPREDVRHRFPDIAKMRRLLKFRPRVKQVEGLQRTIEWYRRFDSTLVPGEKRRIPASPAEAERIPDAPTTPQRSAVV